MHDFRLRSGALPVAGDWPGMDFLLLRSQLADAESSCGSDSIA